MKTTAKSSERNFQSRHLGLHADTEKKMLSFLNASTSESLSRQAIPEVIQLKKELNLPEAATEAEALAELKNISKKNRVAKSYIGMGYYDTHTPTVIQRTILENPGWYTQYTPYQAEIAQGRLEALLNFQTMIGDLTGLPISNASLLDEGTAVAEAMNLCFNLKERDASRPVFVDEGILPQSLAILKTRAEPLSIQIITEKPELFDFSKKPFAVILQYPGVTGSLKDPSGVVQSAKKTDSLVIMACDLLSLTLIRSPGELGADVAVGSSQRLGVPMGFGGPHAGFMSTKDEYKRLIPGRIVGVSKDVNGKNAYRLALQTREQHIRREKATSNICTAQVLLAIISSMYAVYHGPQGLKQIALRVHEFATLFAMAARKLGLKVANEEFFDTVTLTMNSASIQRLKAELDRRQINVRIEGTQVGVAFDETCTAKDWMDLISCFVACSDQTLSIDLQAMVAQEGYSIPTNLQRKTEYLSHPVFNLYHTETELLRYIKRLESRDLSLTHSMIPLGSCTMKLNAASELYPITWPEFGKLHPFAPLSQTEGYHLMTNQLENWLSEITSFAGTSLQPNAGSQGEYAGLLVIRKYHQSRGDSHRNICLIPKSAHGTNPASATMVGMEVVAVDCDSNGNVDVADLKRRAEEHAKNLSALMITYPSTHGVFEKSIREICEIVHKNGGQVYMDGANMNAQVGLCRPGDFGPDVCHLNLHKTFCIPHGGGGPGMGPICVAKHLVPYLPGHPLAERKSESQSGAVSAAPFGSASILPISWMYIRMMGAEGLKKATEVAILNANYVAKKLNPFYPVLYKGESGWVAHECIVDLRPLKAASGVEVEDVAKRLMDYGFHAPTISFPVIGTMMIEPTESESLEELDRFCDAMISIRKEIEEIEKGTADKKNNVLKNAPHTAETVVSDNWNRPYSREKAAFPLEWVKARKFWPYVSRIDNVYGDRNLVCACPPMESYSS